MKRTASIPTTVDLVRLSQLYDECVRRINTSDNGSEEEEYKLNIVCRILLATKQLSIEQRTTVHESKRQSELLLESSFNNEIAVQSTDESNFNFTWWFERNEEVITISTDQLEEEEHELIGMANAPIP